jgi:hypothetical protein
MIKKTNLLERLEIYLLNPDRVKDYQPEAEKREIELKLNLILVDHYQPHRHAEFQQVKKMNL